MYGINGKPWLGLDKFIDIESLNSLRPEFALALAKSNQYRVSGTVGGQAHHYDQNNKDLTVAVQHFVKDPNFQYRHLIKDLPYEQITIFCKYMYDLVGLGEVIPLRKLTGTYYDKHRDFSSTNSPAYTNFEFFHKWLESQNMFEEIGRVLIFINEPGVASTMHADYGDHQSRRDPFIWLSIDGRKKFWVYDPKTDSKHYITDSVATFDNADWHGSDPCEYVGWSLRVDGIFTKEFLQKTELDIWIEYNSQFESMKPKTT